MATFKAYVKKESLELFRSNKLFILIFIALFFALSTPVMLYFTPKILASQFGEIDFSQMMTINVWSAYTNYLGDIYQIFFVVALFFALKIFTDEFKSQKIVMPLMAGVNLKVMYIAKFAVLSALVSIIVYVVSMINYGYSALVFENTSLSFIAANWYVSGLLLYFLLHVALLYFMSTIRLKGFLIMFFTLAHFFAMPSIVGMFRFIKISPYQLVSFDYTRLDSTVVISQIVTVCCIVLILTITSKIKINDKL